MPVLPCSVGTDHSCFPRYTNNDNPAWRDPEKDDKTESEAKVCEKRSNSMEEETPPKDEREQHKRDKQKGKTTNHTNKHV
jgi:hypothetical protein